MKTTRAIAALAAAALLPIASDDPATALPEERGQQERTTERATTDGPVVPLAPVRVNHQEVASFRGAVYFQGTTAANGTELWVSDGTAAGTRLVVDLAPGAANSVPQHLVVFGGRLYFTATTVASGNEWWSTDGTAAGTQQTADIFAGAGSAYPDHPVVLGNRLYYAAYEPMFGRELWAYEPNVGAYLAADVRTGAASGDPKHLTAFGDRLVYSGYAAADVVKPWVTIGGVAGAKRLDTMDVGVNLAPRDFTRAGSQLVFAAGDAVSGVELWATGGQPGDARGIRDIYPGATSSDPRQLVTFGNRVLLRAGTPTEGYELWATDGTTQGTVLVKDVDARPGISSFPDSLVVLGGQALFTAEDGVHGRELWTTRGTGATTQLVADGNPGPATGTTRDPALGTHPVAGRLLYAGTDGAGTEPWTTDGTASGTRRIADLAVGGSSAPHDLGTVRNTVLLGASDGVTDRLYAWTAVGSTVTPGPARKYSARKARRQRIVVPVTVTSSLGSPLSGGTVVLTRKGRVVGTAPLVDGTALVRITTRLRAGRTHQVVAAWAGDLSAAGSISETVTFKVKRKPRRH